MRCGPVTEAGITCSFGCDQCSNGIHSCRICPVSRADGLVRDDTLPVDNVRLGKLERAVKTSNRSPGVQQHRKIQSVSLHELGNGARPTLIHAHSEDFKIRGSQRPVQLFEHRHFLYAGRAPRGPEMNHNNFASVVRETYRSSIQGRKMECRCPVTFMDDLHGLWAFFREQIKKKEPDSGNEDNHRHIFFPNRNHGPVPGSRFIAVGRLRSDRRRSWFSLLCTTEGNYTFSPLPEQVILRGEARRTLFVLKIQCSLI